jgi:hypothetical protein
MSQPCLVWCVVEAMHHRNSFAHEAFMVRSLLWVHVGQPLISV